MRKWILPEQIEDILPAEASRIESLRRKILDLFFSRKFELVIPPLPDGFRGLDASYTRCRNFRFGVAFYSSDRERP